MDKPNFLIVGAQKSATSAISDTLASHPKIEMSAGSGDLKEIHFFDIDANYKKGLNWYVKQFQTKKEASLRGEATPNYMFYNKCPGRIKSTLGDIRLIFVLREPVSRAKSQMRMLEAKDGVVFNDSQVDENNEVVRRGFYSRQIKAYENFFDEDKMLVVFYEELVENPHQFYDKIFSFLGVENTSLDYKRSFSMSANRFSWIPRLVRLMAKVYKKTLWRLLGDDARNNIHETSKKFKSFLYRVNASSEKKGKATSASYDFPVLYSVYEQEVEDIKSRYPDARRYWE